MIILLSPSASIRLEFLLEPDEEAFVRGWTSAQDKVVYDAQFASGSYFGKVPLTPLDREAMKLLATRGIRRPHYGPLNVSVSSYSLELSGPHCLLTITNAITESSTSKLLPIRCQQEPGKSEQCGFSITAEMELALQKWPFWSNAEALSARYVYTFKAISVGLILLVKDKISGNICELLPTNP